MTLQEMIEESQTHSPKPSPPGPRDIRWAEQPTGPFLVDQGNGEVAYMVVTEDGRLVMAENPT